MKGRSGGDSPEHFIRLRRQIQVEPGQPTVVAATDHIVTWKRKINKNNNYQSVGVVLNSSTLGSSFQIPQRTTRHIDVHHNPDEESKADKT